VQVLKLIGLLVIASLVIGACGASATPSPAATAVGPPSAAASAAPSSAGGGASAVTIQNFSFNPQTVTVKIGTKVTWTNQDSTAHTVTFDTGGAKSGNLAQGATYDQTFSSAGSLTYHCSIHPSMTGTVMVTQ
jgi:plastocyanin